jgi:hypothetical protein
VLRHFWRNIIGLCRRWVAEDDLGTRVEAALDKAEEKTTDQPGSEQQPEAAAEALADDDACHPAGMWSTECL